MAIPGEGEPRTEVVSPPSRPPGPVTGELRQAAAYVMKEGGPEESESPEGIRILALPLKKGSLCLAALAIELRGASESVSDSSFLRLLAATFGHKVERDAALAAAAARERDHVRRFQTVDMQLRVLDRERQKFRAMVNRGDASVMVTDREGKIVWVNSEMMRTHGEKRNPHALHGCTCQQICRNESGPCADCPVARVLGGETIAHQERRRDHEGVTRDLYVTALPIRGPDGRVDEVLVTLQDLTDLEILRRSEARHRQLFEGSADAMLMVDADGLRVLRSNRTAQEMLGYSAEELSGRSLREFHPDYERDRIEPHYRALVEGRQAGSVDAEVFTQSGERLLCNVHGALFDMDGIQVVTVELRDVTMVRRLERELAQADRLAGLGTMSAGIAHEFKNRLAPLRGLVQLLSMSPGNAERTSQYSEMLLTEVDRLAGLVKGVLDLARPQAGRPTRADLQELARTFTEEFERENAEDIQNRRITVTQPVMDHPGLMVSLDVEQIRRVFQNLLKNALEACSEGGVIRVRVSGRGSRATIEIEDSGCGMDPAALSKVFDPFFSTKGVRGTGLGMGIVKSLVQANGGSIELRSREGQGTTVEMVFEAVSPSGIMPSGLMGKVA
jgi:PAS domain S-box-containing protein